MPAPSAHPPPSGCDPDHAHPEHEHEHEHEHGHDHQHDHRRTPSRKLAIALALTVSFMGVEVVMGWLSGSLALLADAGHMLSDAAALGIALFAQRVAMRPSSAERTFGSRRAEVLAAFVNGIALAVTAVLIVREAIERLMTPTAIVGGWMLATAIAGLLINLVAAWVLGAGGRDNTNVRAAFAHVLSDALGSAGAIIAAVVVITLGWTRADPIISLVIAALVLWGGWRLVRETTAILMEGSPPHIDTRALAETIGQVQGVDEVHDLHAWTISEGFDAVTAHIVVTDACSPTSTVREAARAIREKHGIAHVTLQPEVRGNHPCSFGCRAASNCRKGES